MAKIYTDETPMPFGKHKGTAMANVPADYLLYLLDAGIKEGPVKAYIMDNIEALRAEVEKAEANKSALRMMCR